MDDHASLARRAAARFLIALLATLCLAATVLAGPGKRSLENNEGENNALWETSSRRRSGTSSGG